MEPGPKKIRSCPVKVEQQIITVYNLLSEKDKRLYLAVEAVKLPRGGISYLSTLVNCSRTIIHDGLTELKAPELIPVSSIRATGI